MASFARFRLRLLVRYFGFRGLAESYLGRERKEDVCRLLARCRRARVSSLRMLRVMLS